MGHSYLYRCEHCGYEQLFNEGHGFLIHSQPVKEYLESGVKLFHYKTHNLIKKLAAGNNNLYIKAGFQVYKCPKCKLLHDKTEVVIYDDEKIVHKSSFRCNKCNTRLKLTNIHRLKNAICPACHHKTFKRDKSQTALWD